MSTPDPQAIYPLPAQAQGTFLDGKRLAGHKPTLVTNGSTITFGTLAQNYVVECETTGAFGQAHTCLNSQRDGQTALSKRCTRPQRECCMGRPSHAALQWVPKTWPALAPGTKRKSTRDLQDMDNRGIVKASHLLVKHRCPPTPAYDEAPRAQSLGLHDWQGLPMTW